MYIASLLAGSQDKTCTKFVTAWYNNIAGFLSGRQDSTHPVTNDRKPATAPPFTIGSLRRAVPEHCFDRSLLKSGAYLLADLAVVAILLLGSRYIDLQNFWLGLLLWPVYWFCQGAVGTGLWVIAHECGHQSFSKWQAVNDGVGLVLHSCLLAPYFSWKYSHRRHHLNTGHVERDEVFVPKKEKNVLTRLKCRDFSVVRLTEIVSVLITGWPIYLLFNTTGRNTGGKWANHINPYSPIFSKREHTEVVVSSAALVLACSGLYALAARFGWLWLVKVYGVPLCITNTWLVMITLLQHTHPALPHYADKDWEWLRGALSTVDRSYGPLDYVFHHIADTHVAHHLFSTMPHYHAKEATAALIPILGSYYAQDNRNVFQALWTDWDLTHIVAPDTHEGGPLWFQK